MNSNKFFEKCREKGINAAEINFFSENSFEISVFHKELIGYSVSNQTAISARGIYNGKMGFCSTERDDATSVDYLVNGILDSATLMESDDEPIIFEGSKKYQKKNVFSKELEEWAAEDKIKLAFEIEKRLTEADPRISDVEVSYGDTSEERKKINSYGLNLKNKTNYFYISASIVIKDGDEIKSHGDVYLGDKPDGFDIDKFVNSIANDGLSKLHGETIKKGKYKVVFDQSSVSRLLSALISNLSSEAVQKHTSLFEGKLNQQVLSSKLTVWEKPIQKNVYFSYFDAEGVAKYNKVLVDKGVIKTFFYNLVNAKKDGVESTGNASGGGSKVGIGFSNLFVKPGKLNQEELFEKIKDGVFITDITGLHAGLSATSGDFSLQSEGFHIKDGKKASAMTLFTVSGNLFEMFNNIIAVGSDSKLLVGGTNTPSIAFKGLKISAD